MAEEINIEVSEQPEETPAETATEEIAEETEAEEIEEQELWRGIRATLETVAETSRNQVEALSAMNRELESLRNRVPENLQAILSEQQTTIQNLVAQAMETVRVNLQTRNQEPSLEVVTPESGSEAAQPESETAKEEPAKEPEKPHRKRRRI